MTLLTIKSTDIAHGNAVPGFGLYFFMILVVNAIEFIAFVSVGIEIHFSCAVTVHAPAHAEVAGLFYFVHVGDIAMAGLALYATHFCVL